MNVSSGLALMYLPGMSIYASLKRAVSHINLTAREELKEDKISVSVVYPYITSTDFEENTIKAATRNWENTDEAEGEEGGDPPFKADTAEYVAQKIVEGIESGEAEVYVHDWMKRAPVASYPKFSSYIFCVQVNYNQQAPRYLSGRRKIWDSRNTGQI